MNTTPAIQLTDLARRYGKLDAVKGLTLTVRPGTCYGFFGRNGAGKTTTIKCLLNLLKPDSGTVRVFGLDPRKAEVEVKSRLAYVPDAVAFYPWMTVEGTLDEPTSGLDPIARREFIETVIGAYQAGDPENRTGVCVNASDLGVRRTDRRVHHYRRRPRVADHAGRARARFKQIRARFAEVPGNLRLPGALEIKQNGRDAVILANGDSDRLIAALKSEYHAKDVRAESLSLEEIFVASKALKAAVQ